MLSLQNRLRGGGVLAAAGLAAALLLHSAEPSKAGPFSWLTGKNQQQQQQQQPQQQQGGNPGFFPFFGGGRGNGQGYRAGTAPADAPHASELPLNDPEVMLITNPTLGMPTLSTKNVAATKAAIDKYQIHRRARWLADGSGETYEARSARPGSRNLAAAT